VIFVGRERERDLLLRALTCGQGVVLRGNYGYGRTALLRAVADKLAPAWRFVFADFRESSASVCGRLLAAFPARRGRRVVVPMTYREVRSQLAKRAADGRGVVLVLDDVERLTPAKWELLRFLTRLSGLRVVAIIEPFFPERDVTRLRAVLYPSIVLELHRLPHQVSVEFFRQASERYGFGWTDAHVHLLATSRGGYPLEMAEAVARARASVSGAEARRQPVLAADRTLDPWSCTRKVMR
jgi:hypothetical protein